jgi:hypothetical protein
MFERPERIAGRLAIPTGNPGCLRDAELPETGISKK